MAKRNWSVHVTVRAESNKQTFSTTHTVKAQSDCQARHAVKALVERRGGHVVQFHWSAAQQTSRAAMAC